MPAKLPDPPDCSRLKFRKTLSIPSLLERVRCQFTKIPDSRLKNKSYSIQDILMSGLAVFSLKCPSLLDFDRKKKDVRVKHNLQTLFGIKKIPCDTHLRSTLDNVDPEHIRPAVVDLIQELQRQMVLEEYRYLGGYLVSIDGTGLFSSNNISCLECCEKHHRSGEIEYHHQLLASAIVHPERRTVFPLFAEPIKKQDGANKNDCELNAGKRLIPDLKKSFPRLKMIVLQDALSANGPHLETLTQHGFSFIIRVKADGNASLMESVQEQMILGRTDEFEVKNDNGTICGYRFINNVPLNKSHPDLKVNFIDYWEVDKNGKERNFMWITDITLSRSNVYEVMRAGRARWSIENETFNTLKNLGYNLEHNYGHGKKHLSTVFGVLTLLAFLIDQIQESCCKIFQASRNRFHSRIALWEKIRSMFSEFYIKTWHDFYMGIVFGHSGGFLKPLYNNSS